ncbi:hypothetical protein FVE85_9842 [Porphyridium purpureum]|uniref:Uncharacterized protein n=1 Tax=Porphyridium purpureum TaxID=35688 RepID=A0A5J4YJC5_PORPP|nr:hypothetical protein FVE85_9842 [Porphyridium purpureum]|eukprot:POR3924..scf289_17
MGQEREEEDGYDELEKLVQRQNKRARKGLQQHAQKRRGRGGRAAFDQSRTAGIAQRSADGKSQPRQSALASASSLVCDGNDHGDLRPRTQPQNVFHSRRTAEAQRTIPAQLARVAGVAAPRPQDKRLEQMDMVEGAARMQHDSLRRGIILDFDALVRDSNARNMDAFADLCRQFEPFTRLSERCCSDNDDKSNNGVLVQWLAETIGGLSDENAIQTLFHHAAGSDGKTHSSEDVDAAMEVLEGCFPALSPELHLESSTVQAMQDISRRGAGITKILLLHRGSRVRFQRELKQLELSSTFLGRDRGTFDYSSSPPYVDVVQEMAARIKTPLSHCVVVATCTSFSSAPHLIKAGQLCGSRTIMLTQEAANVPRDVPRMRLRDLQCKSLTDFDAAGWVQASLVTDEQGGPDAVLTNQVL